MALAPLHGGIAGPEPADLRRTSFSADTGAIAFAWTDRSENEAGFVIEVSSDGGRAWSAFATTESGVTHHAGTKPAGIAFPVFRVRAILEDGLSHPSNLISHHGTDPVTADTDGDAMPDLFEASNGLDPESPDAWEDADGDRFPNVFEWARGSDPADPEAVPPPDLIVDSRPATEGTTSPRIQDALDQVHEPYRIVLVKEGVYSGSGNVGLRMPSLPTLLLGESGARTAVIDGEGNARLLEADHTMVVDGLTFRRGYADAGGALRISGGPHLVVNCVFSGNSAVTDGGAVHQTSGTLTIAHSTFLENQAGGQGGAVFVGQGELNIVKSVLWNREPAAEIAGASGASILVLDSIVRAYAGGEGVSNADPLLRSDGHLTMASPAIDGGGMFLTSLRDMDGEIRPDGTTTDLGADEWVDGDGDQIPDWWELIQFDSLQHTGAGDADGDGFSNRSEYERGGNAADFFDRAGERVTPVLEIVGGNHQVGPSGQWTAEALEVRVCVNGLPVTGAPVRFAVTDQTSVLLATNPTGASGAGEVGAVTDADGSARVWLRFPTAPGQESRVIATAGEASAEFVATSHPFRMEGLSLWLAADDGVILDSAQRVSLWADRSVSGRNASQDLLAARPVWMDSVVNGRPALRFDGGNDFLTLGAESLPMDGDFTCFVVMAFQATTGARAILSQSEGTGELGKWIYWYSGGKMQFHVQPGNETAHSTAFTREAGRIELLGLKKTGLRIDHYRDGDKFGSAFLDGAPPVVASDVRIGQAEGRNRLKGDIAEILVFDRSLDEAQRKEVEVYLVQKYGLPVSVAVPEPRMEPAGGSHAAPQMVVLSTIEGATIRYTLDGSEPTAQAPEYTGPISVSESGVLKARAFKPGHEPSAVRSEEFAIDENLAFLPRVGLRAWYDAGQGVAVAPSGVPTWRDQSGFGNHAQQDLETRYPAFDDDALHGHAAIRFDGTDDFFSLGRCGGLDSDEFTYLVVASRSVTSGKRPLIAQSEGSGTRNKRVYGFSGNRLQFHLQPGAENLDSEVIDAPADTFEIYAIRKSGNTYEHFRNGNPSGGGSAEAPLPAVRADFRLGQAEKTSFFAGAVAEVLLFDRAIDDGARQDIERYLDTKYQLGLTLKTSAPRIAPLGGTLATPQEITISAQDEATIHYTLDGSAPGEFSPVYHNPLRIDATTTVRAIAIRPGFAVSDGVEAHFTIDPASTGVPRAGLVTWLRADTGVVGGPKDAEFVWRDQSGVGCHALQSSKSKRPTLVSNALAGRSVLRFDGMNDFLTLGAAPALGRNQWTIVAVSSFRSSVSGQAILSRDRSANASPKWMFGLGENAMRFHAQPGDLTVTFEPWTPAMEVFDIHQFTKSGTTYSYFRNGSPAGTGEAGVELSRNESELRIGQAGNASYLNGDLAELLIYDRPLSSTERTALFFALAEKYQRETPPDEDGIPTDWELAHGLDPLRDDSRENPDGDLFDNLAEYHFGLDPQTADLRMDARAGSQHVVALRTNGTVWTWGANDSGQLGDNTWTTRGESRVPTQVGGLEGVVEVAAGNSHNLALRNDGTVWAWGSNWNGELGDGAWSSSGVPVQVTGLAGIVQISAGNGFSLALGSDGTLWAWGANWSGQLGDGSWTTSNIPVIVPGLPAVSAITAGDQHALALTADGAVFGWGANWNAQLADASWANQGSPVPISGLPQVVDLAAGYAHSLAMTEDGRVYAWGANWLGQLGDGTQMDAVEPLEVPGVSHAVAITAGQYHSAAVRSDGTGVAWGANWAGQLGVGGNEDFLPPTTIAGISELATLSAGLANTHVGLNANGVVWTWGENGKGQLADGVPTVLNRPYELGVAGMAQSVATGGSHVLVRTPQNTLLGWGANYRNQLLPTADLLIGTETLIPELSGVVQIAAGEEHSLALTDDRFLLAWGGNSSGQLGVGDWEQRSSPTAIPIERFGGPITKVAAGQYHSVALTADGTIFSWGSNFEYQLGDGTRTTRNVPLPILNPTGISIFSDFTSSSDTSFSIDSELRLWGWGKNTSGQIGAGHTLNSSVSINAAEGFSTSAPLAIQIGDRHVLSAEKDGRVWAWGEDWSGQLGFGDGSGLILKPKVVPGLDAVAAVACGNSHSVALKRDGTVWTWGANWNGQLGLGHFEQVSVPTKVAGLEGVRQIVAAGDLSLAIKLDGSVAVWGYGTNGQLANGLLFRRTTPSPVVDFNAMIKSETIRLLWEESDTPPAPGIPIPLNIAGNIGNPTRVEYFHGGRKIGETSEAPWTFEWTPETWGEFQLRSVVRDQTGRVLSSEPIHVTVLADGDRDGLVDRWEIDVFGDLSETAESDYDNDGLTNIEEIIAGTPPNESDPDADGALDGQEIAEGTNPFVSDTDGDGMPDGYEIQNDLAVLENDATSDKDGDGFPNGWEYERGTTANDRTHKPEWDWIVDATSANVSAFDNIVGTIAEAIVSITGTAENASQFQRHTVYVRGGTYFENLWVPIGKKIAFFAERNPIRRVRIQANQFGLMFFNHGTAVLDGFEFSDSSLRVVENFVSQHAFTSGYGSTTRIANCVFLNIRRSMSVISVEGNSNLRIENSTLSGNRTGSSPISGLSKITIVGSILWNPGSTSDEITAENVVVAHSLIRGGQFASLSVDPGLSSLGRPDVNSASNDAGEEDSRNMFDIDGEERPLGVKSDIGADERIDTDNDNLPDHWEMSAFGHLELGPQDDFDEDGLTNEMELLYSTHPNSADFDNDALIDAGEIAAGCDPWDPDSDGDGMMDGWETASGLNPLLDDAHSDPDGDGLPNGFEAKSAGVLNPHVGDDPQGDSDGDGLTNLYEAMYDFDPSRDERNEDPDQDGLSNAEESTLRSNPVEADIDNDGLNDRQERDLGTNTWNFDSEGEVRPGHDILSGDGLPDGWEVRFGLDPLQRNDTLADDDQDGLSLIQEYRYGTSPLSIDSDGDGTNDGQEIANNTSPTDPNWGEPGSEAETIEAAFVISSEGKQLNKSCAICHWLDVKIDGRLYRDGEIATLKRGKPYDITVVNTPKPIPPGSVKPPAHPNSETARFTVYPSAVNGQTITEYKESEDQPPKAFFVQKDEVLQYIIDNREGLLVQNKKWPAKKEDEPMKKTARIVYAEIIPDYNRDGKIDDADRWKITKENPYRFWVNDDNDWGHEGGMIFLENKMQYRQFQSTMSCMLTVRHCRRFSIMDKVMLTALEI